MMTTTAQQFRPARVRRAFTVRIDDKVVARYNDYQIATNHAADLYSDMRDMIAEGHSLEGHRITVNYRDICEIIY